MADFKIFMAASRERLDEARHIAECLRHDETLHRIAMQAVFALEDCHERFVDLYLTDPAFTCTADKDEII